MAKVRKNTKQYERRRQAVEALLESTSTIMVGTVAYVLAIPEAVASKIVRGLREDDKVHVCGWRRKPTKKVAYAPIFQVGPGEDEPRPDLIAPSPENTIDKHSQSGKITE